jgi:hypothetical protein
VSECDGHERSDRLRGQSVVFVAFGTCPGRVRERKWRIRNCDEVWGLALMSTRSIQPFPKNFATKSNVDMHGCRAGLNANRGVP